MYIENNQLQVIMFLGAARAVVTTSRLSSSFVVLKFD